MLMDVGVESLPKPSLQSRLGVLLFSRQPSILALLPCVDDFQHHVSRHRSNFFLRDIVLLIRLGMQLALLFLFF